MSDHLDLIERQFTENSGPLPEPFYLTTITRERVGRMDPDTQAQALGAWQAAGFPAARDEQGNSVLIHEAPLRAISNLLASFERTVDDIDVRMAVIGRLDEELDDAEQRAVREIAFGHGIDNPTSAMPTDGQLFVLNRIIDRVIAQRDARVTPPAELEPLPATTPEPVADAVEAPLEVPTGKVAEIMEWVNAGGADLGRRAAAALAVEENGKARKSLMAKLAPLAEHGDAPAPAGALVATGTDCGHACCLDRTDPHHDHFLEPGECPTGSCKAARGETDDAVPADPFDGINAATEPSAPDDSDGAGHTSKLDAFAGKADTPEPVSAPTPPAGPSTGRLTPSEALVTIAGAVEALNDVVVLLELLGDRINTETT